MLNSVDLHGAPDVIYLKGHHVCYKGVVISNAIMPKGQ